MHALKFDLFFFFEQAILHSLGMLDGDKEPHLSRAMHSQGETPETLQCSMLLSQLYQKCFELKGFSVWGFGVV